MPISQPLLNMSKPIVSSDLPTSKEILGDFGLYFNNGNIKDLAKVLEKATHVDWHKKSIEAVKIAQRYDIKPIIHKWINLL